MLSRFSPIARRCAARQARHANGIPFETTVVGSMPKPIWLYRDLQPNHPDFERLSATKGYQHGARVWAYAEGSPDLRAAWEDATRVAVHDQEMAGIDIVADGEQRRVNYLDYVMAGMGGFDCVQKKEKTMRAGRFTGLAPRICEPITHREPIVLDDLKFLKSVTKRRVKMTLPGPLTIVDSSYNDGVYSCEREVAFAWAEAINKEALILQAEGCHAIQFDEPVYSRYPEKVAEGWPIEALNRAAEGLNNVETAVHVCYGYPQKGLGRPIKDAYPDIISQLDKCIVDALSLEFCGAELDPRSLADCPSKKVLFGCIFNGEGEVESVEYVRDLLLEAAKYLPAEQILAAPDCGLVTIPQELARAKLRNMVLGAHAAREALSK